MRLTVFSDYSLRLMMFAASHEERLVTIEEVSQTFGISRSHLMKVANLLTRSGFLKAVRGRSGGLSLTRSIDSIRLGDIVRATEPDFAVVECLGSHNTCRIAPSCRLKGILCRATNAFIAELDAHTLRDLVLSPLDFGIHAPPSSNY